MTGQRDEITKLPCRNCGSFSFHTRIIGKEGLPYDPIIVRRKKCKRCGLVLKSYEHWAEEALKPS